MFWPLSLEVAPWFLLGEFCEPEYATETLNSELLYTRHFELHKMSSSDEISPFSFQGLSSEPGVSYTTNTSLNTQEARALHPKH